MTPDLFDCAEGIAIPVVSVVVPTYKRPDMLQRCLTAIVNQDLERCYEIIVCDDGPDGQTRLTVEAFIPDTFRAGCSIKYVPVTATQGPAGARNCGWKAARAEIIAFTDDDTIPDKAWLSEGLRALAKGAGAAAGRIRVPLCEQPTDYELDAAGLGEAEFATANCFVRRNLLVRVGGFDERYTAAWREDSDLHFSLLEVGATIVEARRAIVEHPVRPGRWGISVSQQKKSQFDALLYKKHRPIYKQRIPSPPWSYYAVAVCAVVVLFGALIASLEVALAGLLGWIVLAVLFAIRRLRRTTHSPKHVAEMVATSIVIPPLSVFWRLYGAYKFRVGFW